MHASRAPGATPSGSPIAARGSPATTSASAISVLFSKFQFEAAAMPCWPTDQGGWPSIVSDLLLACRPNGYYVHGDAAAPAGRRQVLRQAC